MCLYLSLNERAVSREKVRLKRDANVVDIDFEEMLDDQEEKTKDIG